VMGIVLAALAVQYVLNGVTGYYQLLRPLTSCQNHLRQRVAGAVARP
jgi:hypothetical protein